MVKAARCFAVRETTPSATSRAESAERSSVIPDGKANTALSVSNLGTITQNARVMHVVMIIARIKSFTSARKCSLRHVFK